MKCHGDGKPYCQHLPKCVDACNLRVQYVAGYEAGRAATVAQWGDHLKRMKAALLANSEPPNVRANLDPTAPYDHE